MHHTRAPLVWFSTLAQKGAGHAVICAYHGLSLLVDFSAVHDIMGTCVFAAASVPLN